MEEYKIITHDENETIAVAQNIESEKFPNMVICLNGDLGSGKTLFTKGFAHAMGIDEITSPTFTIIKEYVGELPLYHMDVYRLEDSKEDIGIEEYFDNLKTLADHAGSDKTGVKIETDDGYCIDITVTKKQNKK